LLELTHLLLAGLKDLAQVGLIGSGALETIFEAGFVQWRSTTASAVTSGLSNGPRRSAAT
jgi:hypothetical protein